MTTKIVSARGSEISSLDDWAKLHKEIHWKEGRSAYSIADFILNCGGVPHLESQLSGVLKQHVSINSIAPEKDVRFDRYGRGRCHDLAIDCVVSGEKSLFAGLEAKVDEKFGKIVQDELEAARKALDRNHRSKAVERIEALPARFSPKLDVNSMLDIRYQLIHGIVGTVSARQANREPYDYYVFYVLVFKTSLYDEQVAEENHRDYRRFMGRVGGGRVGGSTIESLDTEAHLLTIDDKPLTCIYEQVELPA